MNDLGYIHSQTSTENIPYYLPEDNSNTFEKEEEKEEASVEPFNPNDIHIERKLPIVETCIKRIVQGSIVLNPDFQRHEIWNDEQKSRLIESLMLKIPIPMFYVSSDANGTYTIVDGLQRISSFRDFMLGEKYLETRDEKFRGRGMKLRGLEFWTEYNGCTFAELPMSLQNRIGETELTFIVINPGTPEDVKRNIFRRINTGGLYLNPHEIRNALYTGASTNLLDKLSKTAEFKKATGNSVNPKRMEDEEIILRCLSFMVRSENTYPRNDDMDEFLCDTMIIINSYPDFNGPDFNKVCRSGKVNAESIRKFSVDELEKWFRDGMKRSYELFGEHCFRRSFGESKRLPINKSLFEMWGSLLGMISDDEFSKIVNSRQSLIAEYRETLDRDDFKVWLKSSWKASYVIKRFETLRNLIKKYCNDQ